MEPTGMLNLVLSSVQGFLALFFLAARTEALTRKSLMAVQRGLL